MAKQVILFAILLSLAFLTACLYKINIFLFIILSIFWILIFILTQQNENLRSVGLFTLISYVFYLTLVIPLENCDLEFIASRTILVFVAVIVASIPMFVVRLLQHNPYKEDSNVSPKWDSYNKINQNDKLKVNQNNYRISIIVSKLTKFLKPINHKLKSEDESSKQTFLNYMTNKCKNIFKILNDVFARNLSNKEESVNNTEEFRYSVRFIIVILICFT